MKHSFIFIILCFRFSMAMANDSTKVEIHFPFNLYSITNVASEIITAHYKIFDTANNILTGISIYGHTDQIGSHNYNDILSIKRANAAAKYLQNIGIENNIISVIQGLGKHQLQTTLMTENERAINRRVAIIFYYEKKKKPIVEKIVEQPKPTVGNTFETKPTTQKLADKIKDPDLKVGDRIELPFILFVGGEHIFLQISYPYLDELLDVMKNNSTLEIEIVGHVCCTDEKDGYDFSTGKKNLSVARAKAVYDFLKMNNIDKSRMDYNGFGHQFPITEERTEAEKTRNRRVEIKIIKK